MQLKDFFMKFNVVALRLFFSAATFCLFSTAEAGSPLWTFTPLTPTTLTITTTDTAVVQYTLTNQSRKQHTLSVTQIPGVTQDTSAGNCTNPVTLNYQGSCTLTLNITGSAMSGNIQRGPTVCEEGNALQCYQPSPRDMLNITLSETPTTPNYAYITNVFNNQISQCSIDTTTGDLSNCVSTTSSFEAPAGITFSNGFAYIAHAFSNVISKCTVNAMTGALSDCTSAGSHFSAPLFIAIHHGFAYATTENSLVCQCTVHPTTGEFSDCTPTGSNFGSPAGIALNHGFAYITNLDEDFITQCAVDATTGEFSNCVPTGGEMGASAGITLSNGFAYITHVNDNTVSQCTVDPITGALSNCASTSGLNNPVGIAINHGFAYIALYTSQAVIKCTINTVTGALSNCGAAATGFNSPFGIAFHG